VQKLSDAQQVWNFLFGRRPLFHWPWNENELFSKKILETFGPTHKLKLGHQFEALAQAALIPGLTHYSNLQVQGEGRTLGEFDLLAQINQRWNHVEMCCKFYLHHDGQWLGPNTRDRLDLKWKKLTEKQLKLTELPEAKALLNSLQIEEVPQGQIFSRGFLYREAGSVARLPTYVSINHPLGVWYQHQNFPWSDMEETYVWKKEEWLQAQPYDKKIFTKNDQLNRATRVYFRRMGQKDFEEAFIVPNDWPKKP